MTVASLGLAVDTSSVVAATPALDRMTAASQKAEAAAGQLGRASSGASGGVRQLEKAAEGVAKASMVMNAARGNTANIAAQFQDIAVSAQMGMGALQIGLQQGTQLAAVISSMENPIKGLGAAFLSVISPVSLLVIVLTSLAAVGLQMVNWTAVAKAGLNAVADALVVIAPFAVAAAAGLALLYAPTLISGAASLVLSLGNVAKGVWEVATAIYATVGLPVLLIAGFTALVAAAIIWRDDLTRMLGVDIVKVAQDGINSVVGFFVGAFNAVTGVWGNLPAIFADIFTMAMNGAIDIVQNGINGIVGPINDLLKSVGLDGMQLADLSGFKGQVSGAASEAGKIISDAFGKAQGADYVGIAIKGIQAAASGAADALHGLASGLKDVSAEDKKAAKEAKRQAEAYDDITRGANQRIEASRLEMQTLGMTTEQIHAQQFAQELLNKAANGNVDLTRAQVDELTGLGAAMAAAEAAAKSLRDVYEFGKSTFKGFFSDFKSGIEDGKSLWASLGDAAANALQRIADKALEMAADGVWDMIFGAISGSLFGGFQPFGGSAVNPSTGLPGLFANGGVFASGVSGFSNQVVDTPTLFPFAKGIGLMGEAGPEAIMPLRRGPDGRLGVAATSNDNGPSIVMHNTINANSEAEGAAAARGFSKELDRLLPAAMERYNRNPYRRTG